VQLQIKVISLFPSSTLVTLITLTLPIKMSLRVGHDWATSLSLFTFHFHALEKQMATHSSVLAWRIPGVGKSGGLSSMGLHRVGHDWSNLAAAALIIGHGLMSSILYCLENSNYKRIQSQTIILACSLQISSTNGNMMTTSKSYKSSITPQQSTSLENYW